MTPLTKSLLEVQTLQPGSFVNTIRDGKVVPLQVVKDAGGQIMTTNPDDPRTIDPVKRSEIAVPEDEDGGPAPGQPGPPRAPVQPRTPAPPVPPGQPQRR